MKYYLRRNSHRIAWGFVSLLLIAAGLYGLKYLIDSRGEVVSSSDETVNSGKVTSVESRILSFGAFSWTGMPKTNADQQGALDALEDFSRADYDMWVANLTCGIKLNDECRESDYDEFKKSFSIVAIGNRYSQSRTMSTTVDRLKADGIQYFGKTDTSTAPSQCEIISLTAKSRVKDSSAKASSLPIVFCDIDGSVLQQDIIDEITKMSSFLPVWVYATDGGQAGGLIGRDVQYRSYIDAGADLVVGVGYDMPDKSESYNGKLIAYSLGRPIGSEKQPATSDAVALLDVTIKTKLDDSVIRWQEIVKSCETYDDLCLDIAKSRGLERLSYQYDYSIVGLSTKGGIAPTSASQNAKLTSTLDWIATRASLTEPVE